MKTKKILKGGKAAKKKTIKITKGIKRGWGS